MTQEVEHDDRLPHFQGVYAIRNRVSGAMYVGGTSDLRQRWYQHRTSLVRGDHFVPALQTAWAEMGGEQFEVIMIEAAGPHPAAIDQAERRWLIALSEQGVTLYNRHRPQRDTTPLVEWNPDAADASLKAAADRATPKEQP